MISFAPIGVVLVLVLLSILFERRYRGRRNASGAQWQSTGEKFVDPTTGKLTEVRYNPQTGERAYVDVTSEEASPK